ncbi:MAG: hypothetical protein WAU07_01790 [Microgenomates group bacterium]
MTLEKFIKNYPSDGSANGSPDHAYPSPPLEPKEWGVASIVKHLSKNIPDYTRDDWEIFLEQICEDLPYYDPIIREAMLAFALIIEEALEIVDQKTSK